MTLTSRLRLPLGISLAGLLVLSAARVVGAQNPHLVELDRLRNTNACVGCDLTGADFARKTLKTANFSGAKLESASFYRGDLTGANFDGANLTKANFSMANLQNTNFSNADLTGANLAGATAAMLSAAITTETTVCPDGQSGPCR